MDKVFGLAVFDFDLLDLGFVDQRPVEAEDLLSFEELGLDLWLRLGHSYFISEECFFSFELDTNFIPVGWKPKRQSGLV